MLWDDMTYEEKYACYDSYVQECIDEFGDNKEPMSFEEFNMMWSGFYYYTV